MAGSNGATPQVSEPQHADATGVFARIGATLPLGEQTVTVRMLVNRDVKAQKPLIDSLTYSNIDGSPGEQFYSGAMSSNDEGEAWGKLAAWLTVWCDRPVRVEMLDEATPDEVIALIDSIYEQSGLAWMKRIMGNVAAAARLRQVTLLTSVPIGTESGSIPSTSPSSPSLDHQHTPDS